MPQMPESFLCAILDSILAILPCMHRYTLAGRCARSGSLLAVQHMAKELGMVRVATCNGASEGLQQPQLHQRGA